MARKVDTFEVTKWMWVELKKNDRRIGSGEAQVVDVYASEGGPIYTLRHKHSGRLTRPTPETLFGQYRPSPATKTEDATRQHESLETRVALLERELASLLAWKQKVLDTSS